MKRIGSVLALICLAFVPFLIAAGQVGWEGKTGSSYPVQSALTNGQYLQSVGVKGQERWNTPTDIVVLDNSDNTTITSVAMRGQTHRITAAATPVLPAAVVGMSGTFRATTAAAFGIRADASDGFNLYNTAYGNGRAIRSSGLIYDAVYIECSTVNKWDVYPVTVFTDGG